MARREREAGSTPLELGGHLDAATALGAIAASRPLTLEAGAAERIDAAAKRVADAVAKDERVYGITTGFGSNADRTIPPDEVERLQENLLVSHAFGDGPLLPDPTVRLAWLLRIHALAQGSSGIRRSTIEAMMRLHAAGIVAEVPARGSVGASGDLAPLAFLALPLIGRGRVRVDGRSMEAAKALRKAGLEPTVLCAKEGLALVNGMQVSLAIGLRALARAERAILLADVAAALSMEALAARGDALAPGLHAARGHPGQRASAKRLAALVKGSRLVDAPVEALPGKRIAPQDAYGTRCAPQVHGAVADGVAYARGALEREIDAVTDNPLVLGKRIVSGGNFHGEPIALPLDHLRLCVHELGSISERRTATLVDPKMNEGLPAYLAPHHGLHSGFMIPQYVAAAQVSESKQLCFPASADSIVTGAGIEDHVSMAPIAARRTEDVLELVESVLAIEVLTACQAIDMRPREPAPRTMAVKDVVRAVVPFRSADRLWRDALAAVKGTIADGSLLAAAGLDLPLPVV